MTNQKKVEQKGSVNPVVAAVTGAIVGAGIAAAGVVLSNKKNRDKVGRVLTNVKNQALDYVEDMQKQAQDTKVEVKEKVKKLVA